MFKNQIKLNFILLFCLALVMGSCSKEDASADVENYGFTETYEMQKSLNAGIHGCLEIVFPISVEMPDGTILEFESFLDGKEQLQAWKEANPDLGGRPKIVFPVEAVTEDGAIVSVESKHELRRLIRSCRPDFPPRPRHLRACFKLQYPVSLAFPDGTVEELENRVELKHALRQWKKDNPDAAERPELVFPLIIVYEDGSTQEIASKEELMAAKKACRD